ncbi:MAG: glutamyl-tRNA reductase [Planctomycetota bacterium]
MRILLLGINHRTAPVALRESIAVTAERLPGVLARFGERFGSPREAVLLSTCNRTELYVARPAHAAPDADALRRFLAEQTGASVDVLAGASIHREQQTAVHHLFRVTAGLDAMAVGEPQVLGQVRRAYDAAQSAGTVGPTLHRVFQTALSETRKAHRASGVDTLRQSVSSMAVEFSGNLFESYRDKTVVGIGAGEITKATLRQMLEKSPGRTWVVNRTMETGLALARTLGLSLGPSNGSAAGHVGGARSWEELDEVLVEADVVLTGTGASEPVITVERFKPLLKRRRHRPMFLIDLAVPRDVESAVGTLPNVYLYNLDDLNAALSAIPQRREKIERCEALVREAADRCVGASQHQDLGVLVRQLRNRLRNIGDTENLRTKRKLQALHDAGEYQKIDKLLDEHTHRFINKVLHLPLSQLDTKDKQAPLGFYAAALRRLFGLDDTPSGSPNPTAEDDA